MGKRLLVSKGRPYNRPYTVKGIRRFRCARCPSQAVHQWQICADGNRWRPLCLKCDVALNGVVLKFMGDASAKRKLRKYEALQRAKGGDNG